MDDAVREAHGYPVTIRRDPDEGFVADIPDFPTVFTNGETPEEALANAYEGIALALEWYHERGQQPPVPAAATTVP